MDVYMYQLKYPVFSGGRETNRGRAFSRLGSTQTIAERDRWSFKKCSFGVEMGKSCKTTYSLKNKSKFSLETSEFFGWRPGISLVTVFN